MELKGLEIHLLMALRDACAYNLDGDFDELFRVVEIENSVLTLLYVLYKLRPPKKLYWTCKRWNELKGKHMARLVLRAMPHSSPKSAITP